MVKDKCGDIIYCFLLSTNPWKEQSQQFIVCINYCLWSQMLISLFHRAPLSKSYQKPISSLMKMGTVVYFESILHILSCCWKYILCLWSLFCVFFLFIQTKCILLFTFTAQQTLSRTFMSAPQFFLCSKFVVLNDICDDGGIKFPCVVV